MGKSRKPRFSGGHRQNQPTGLPSVKDSLAETGGGDGGGGRRSGIPASINTCVEQLQSHEALEKECGLMTLAELCGQPEAGPILRDLRLTRHVAPLVVDSEENVRVAAVGTLLAMADAARGGAEIEAMIKDDVLTPVVALLNESFPKGWTPGSSPKELDIFVNAVSLLRSICESSPTGMQIFNREGVIASLLHATDVKVFSQTVVVAVCECLLTVTESNPPAIEILKESADAFRSLQHLVQSQPSKEPGHENSDAKTLVIGVLAAGILLNLSGDDLSSAPPTLLSSILTLIPAVLNINVENSINDLKRLKPKGKAGSEETDEAMEEETNGHSIDDDVNGHSENGMQDGVDPEIDEEGEEEEEVEGNAEDAVLSKSHRSKLCERICDILSAQQMALEILTNVCSAADDEWEDDDDENDDMSSTSSGSHQDLAGSHENITMEDSCLVLPSEIREALISSEMISTITRCCGSSLFQSRAGLEEYLDLAQARLIFRKLCLVQSRSLTALHNLVTSEVASLGSVEDLVSLLAELNSTLVSLSTSNLDNVEMLEATTSAIRAVVTKISSTEKSSSAKIFAPSQQDVELLVNIFKLAKGDSSQNGASYQSIKINVVRISSLIAAAKSVKTQNLETFKAAGNFLLSAAVDADVAVAAEALDAIFDVFGDDDDISDDVRKAEKEIRLVSRLSDLVTGFHEKAKLQRKQIGPEQKAVVQTVKSNLSRFIKYKAKGK